LPIAILAINFLMRPARHLYFTFDCLIFGLLFFLICYQIKENYKKAFMLSCAVVLFANFYLNTCFYIQLAAYKGQITAADYINQNAFNKYHLYSLRTENNIFQFYCKRPVDFISLEQFNKFKPADSSAFYVNQQSMDLLVQSHADFKIIKAFQNYPQENMSLRLSEESSSFISCQKIVSIKMLFFTATCAFTFSSSSFILAGSSSLLKV